MNESRSPGYVLPATLAVDLLAAHDKVGQPVGYGVHDIVRVADELGQSRETAIADFFAMVDRDEMATRPASLQDIVLLALSQGVSFDSTTQAFLLDLCERLDGEVRADVPRAAASRLTRELEALGRILNELMLAGDDPGSDAALAAQVWRIEAIAAHARQLDAIAHHAAARATIMRRHGLHFFEVEDLKAIAQTLTLARDIGEPPNHVSLAAWRALARGVGACFWITMDERCFMLDQMASYLLDDAGLTLNADARRTIEAVVNGETEPVAA